MVFEWDAAKNVANIAKHSIDFEDAVQMFEGPTLLREDMRREYGEIRMIAYGAIDDLEFTVVYTPRGTRRRIISARRSHKRERETYRKAYPRRSPSR